jgi:GR25 family glycosyltransferase involved in LPS biosynthesis
MKLEQWHIWALVGVVFIVIGLVVWKKKIEMFETKDYLEGIDVIYWINLDRSPDRRKRMKKMFKDPAFKGKKIIRISAVDGKSPDIDQVLNANFDGMHPEKYDKTIYACTLSHINAIRDFKKSDNKVALIMEDDSTLEFKKYWKKTTKQIMDEAPSDWDIIQLTYTVIGKVPKKLYTKNNRKKWQDRYYGTGSYIINKNNINIPNPIKINSDSDPAADVYLYNIFNTYTYKYPMFIYRYDIQSTIHQDHINNHNESKKKITELFTNPKLV